jgi:hypothetical protein
LQVGGHTGRQPGGSLRPDIPTGLLGPGAIGCTKEFEVSHT